MRITKLTGKTPFVRETDVYERTDALVVALHPRHLSIRLKGHKDAVDIDYAAVLDLARKLDARKRYYSDKRV
jgi:hypothetical protein